MTRGQQLAVAATCLLAATTYAGAVTTWAMGLFVLPGVAGAALLASLLAARRMSGMAIGVVGALVLGWAELANISTGTANGPAARSTALAAGCTVIAVVLAQSRWPALFLAGVAGVVAGALFLGSAGEVRIVVVATAVCAALALGSIERSHRHWAAPPGRGMALVLLSLLAGATAGGAVLLQAEKDPRDPALATQGRQYPGIKPAWSDPLDAASSSLGGPTGQERTNPGSKQARPHTTPDPAPARKHSPRSMWLYAVAAIALVVLLLAALVAARLLFTRFAWLRVRRRLAAGGPADQVTGAWAWTRLRLEACRLPLAADVSPDSVAAGRAAANLPAAVFMPLRELAAATTTAAFAYEPPVAGAAFASWAAAGRAETSARELLTRSGRARLALRGPALAALPEDEATPRTGRRLTTTQATIIAALGLILCFSVLARFDVFSRSNSSKDAVQPVSTPKKSATAATQPPTATVTTPTTRRQALASPAKAPPAPSRTLVPGETGSQVKVLQLALAALGFSPGGPDGGYGVSTQTAVARFQASRGLAADGVLGPRTLVALRDALSRRSRR